MTICSTDSLSLATMYSYYFIVHAYVSNDRTDYNTLIPVLEKHKEKLGIYPSDVTADSGYSSEKNLIYLEEKGITSYIKLQMHEKMKKRAYKKDIGRYYNMEHIKGEGENYYLCAEGRRIEHQRTEVSNSVGYPRTFEVYSCTSCKGCTKKKDCLYRYKEERDVDKNKTIKVNERWNLLKIESHKNILSEKGILNRQIRSIQTEGHFGDIKENDGFRKFNNRTKEKVYKEFMIYAFGRNLNKYHRFLHEKIRKYEGTQESLAA